jgi:hypothetical protein
VYIKFNKEESNPNFRFRWHAAELVQVEWEPMRVPIHRQLSFACAVSMEKNMDQKSPPRPYPCPPPKPPAPHLPPLPPSPKRTPRYL